MREREMNKKKRDREREAKRSASKRVAADSQSVRFEVKFQRVCGTGLALSSALIKRLTACRHRAERRLRKCLRLLFSTLSRLLYHFKVRRLKLHVERGSSSVGVALR